MKENVADRESLPAFEPETVLKQDIFSRIVLGRLGPTGEKAILRDLSVRRWWVAPISTHLARREVRALKALAGVVGIPRLIASVPGRIYREWVPGLPLHVAEPYGDVAYFRQARGILAELRRRGVTHNDLAKPQNWLRTHDGEPCLVDFQLAHVHRRKRRVYRIMAYEDSRHLIKHKVLFCPDTATARERAIAKRRSLPSLIWRHSVRVVYKLVTRRLLHWSDGEGGGDRLVHYGPALAAFLERHPAVAEAVVTGYSHPSHRIEGLYVFASLSEPVDGLDLAALSRKELGPLGGADLVQLVPALPRSPDGEIRRDLLRLVAGNLIDEIEPLTEGDAALQALMARIVAERVNLSDRHRNRERDRERPHPSQ